MNFLEHVHLIERLHTLIKRKGTGTPDKLASRLNISRASVFRQIEIMKQLGASIKFCKYAQSYIYVKPFVFFEK